MPIITVHNPEDMGAMPRHPLGSKAKVLLTSVFGPYAQDDEFGSRVIDPMELYHNQITRVQGPFSLRMFHRSWGLMLMQCNMEAPCTCLDFPTLDRFIDEIRENQYDIVGISSILPNIHKVKKMCELIRQHLPNAIVVVGGHLANLSELNSMIDADYIVRGDGVRWFRRFLGEDEEKPINHPLVDSGINLRAMGINLNLSKPFNIAATLIPSLGCPIACNFCSTSATFGGRGKYVNYYETGDELFDIMCQLEKEMNVCSFFVMDENFLLYRKRALRLLQLMQENEKSWELQVFSSANALKMYTIEQLVGLGIAWVWLGLEGKNSRYEKLKDTDTQALVKKLQSHGIHVLGSTIIGLEDHTPDNIDKAIDYAVSHDADFHQFMLYFPLPGTPLYTGLSNENRLLGPDEIDYADVHGQYRFNFRHSHIKAGDETGLMLRAFRRDFEVNGPSVLRFLRTTFEGWKKYRNHPEKRIRERYNREAKDMPSLFAGAIWAGRRWFRKNPIVKSKLSAFLNEICDEFGMKARIAAPLIGQFSLFLLWRENRRLAKGWHPEPPTFYQKNYEETVPARRHEIGGKIRWITPN